MMELIIGPWLWYAIALVLVVFEGMRPSGLFAAMAVTAGILGGLVTAYPELTWQQQLGIYAASTMVLSFIFIKIVAAIRKNDDDTPESKTMIGEEFALSHSIQNNFGEIELDGVFWSLKGPDMEKGSYVRVVGVDGQMLAVMPISALSKEIQKETTTDEAQNT